MKFIHPLLLFLGLAFAVPAGLRAQEEVDPFAPGATNGSGKHSKPKRIRTRVEYIELSLEQMIALMDDPEATKTDEVLRDRVEKLIREGKAHLFETQMITSRSGQKATSESIREFMYPTEYESAMVPGEVHIHTRDGDRKLPPGDCATGPTPTAFETRNLGSDIEVEADFSYNDIEVVDLRLESQIVCHVGNTVWTEWRDNHGKANIETPMMYVLRVHADITLAAGAPCLAAALTPKDKDGKPDSSRKLLVFAYCDVIEVDPE